MTSIFLNSGYHLVSNPAGHQPHDRSAALLVFSRGIFNCLAPRIYQMQDRHEKSLITFIASSADTFHLSLELMLWTPDVCHQSRAAACLRKLAQVKKLCWKSLTALSFSFVERRAPLLIQRLGPTLEEFRLVYAITDDDFALVMAAAIAPLHNLRVLQLPGAINETCSAIAAGAGARLRTLQIGELRCDEHGLETLVNGCPEILHFELIKDRWGCCVSLGALSKLRYLQTLCAPFASLFCKNDHQSPQPLCVMQQSLSNWPCLTHLDVFHRDRNVNFTEDMATAIATTVGVGLRVLRVRVSERLSCVAFATLCNADAFRALEELEISLGAQHITNDDNMVSVSLPQSLRQLVMSHVHLSARILTQLLVEKPMLEQLEVAVKEYDAHNIVESSEADWLGKLVQCPLRHLHIIASLSGVSEPERIGHLSGTLTNVTLACCNDRDPKSRDLLLAALCSRCVLIESMTVNYYAESGVVPIDSSVAFAGLRNNERLRVFCIGDVNSVAPIIDEFASMRSQDVEHIAIGWRDFRTGMELKASHVVTLAERFVHLARVGQVEGGAKDELAQRYPLVVCG